MEDPNADGGEAPAVNHEGANGEMTTELGADVTDLVGGDA